MKLTFTPSCKNNTKPPLPPAPCFVTIIQTGLVVLKTGAGTASYPSFAGIVVDKGNSRCHHVGESSTTWNEESFMPIAGTLTID